MRMSALHSLRVCWVLSLMQPVWMRADTLTVTPVADTYLRNGVTVAQGVATELRLGVSSGNGITNHVLVRFSLAALPAQATITDAALTVIHTGGGGAPTNYAYGVSRVLREWSEADSTWTVRLAPAVDWGAPGAQAGTDYALPFSATQPMAGSITSTFQSAGLVADVQAWVQNPSSNFGWFIASVDEGISTGIRVGSRESAVPPSLVVQYTVPAAGQDWIAYNDCAWHQDPTLFSGQGVEAAAVNYTTNGPAGQTVGALMSTNGDALVAQVRFSGVPAAMLPRDLALPAGTPAETVFAGRIGPKNAANWGSGTVFMTLTNLLAEKQYSVILWSSRGSTSAAYSNRWTDITISSVDTFVNNSSTGIQRFTTTTGGDSARVVSVSEGGLVVRYDAVRPGADGTIIFALTANGLAGTTETNGYLNAFMVQQSTVSATDTDSDGMDDAWEQTHFGGLGAAADGDPDADGSNNYAESRAGTDPNSAASRLVFAGATAPAGVQPVLSWQSVNGKNYSVLAKTNLLQSWDVVLTGIPGTAPMNTATVSIPVARGFWRIKVE